VADERVKRDYVEFAVVVAQMVGVASLVDGVVGQPFVQGQPLSGIDQGRAVVDADDGRIWPGQTSSIVGERR
jgi:hypothetical protein